MESIVAALPSVINHLKSVRLHLSGQPNFQRGGRAKLKDGIIEETGFFWTFLVDQFMLSVSKVVPFSAFCLHGNLTVPFFLQL